MRQQKIKIPYLDEGHRKLALMSTWLCVSTLGIYRKKFLSRDYLSLNNDILSNSFNNKNYDIKDFQKILVIKSIPADIHFDPDKEPSKWAGRDIEIFLEKKDGSKDELLPLFWVTFQGYGSNELVSFLEETSKKTNLHLEIMEKY